MENTGKWDADTDKDALFKQYPQATVTMLQQGVASPELKFENYTGCTDAGMISTHRVPDRNADFCNFGGSEELVVGHYGPPRRALVRYDLTRIPKDAKVKAAYLKLYAYKGSGRTGRGWPHNKLAYRVLKPWGAGIGNGSLYDKKLGRVREGECSWLCAKYPDGKWAAPGCSKPGKDRSAEPVASSVCDAQKKNEKGHPLQVFKVWIKWDLTKLAQDWVAQPEKNFGVLLDVKDGDLKTWHDKIGKDALYFRSANFRDPAFRPRLVLALESAEGGDTPLEIKP